MNFQDHRPAFPNKTVISIASGLMILIGAIVLYTVFIGPYVRSLGWPSCKLSLEGKLRTRLMQAKYRNLLGDLTNARVLTREEKSGLLAGITRRDLDCKNFPEIIDARDSEGNELEMRIENKDGGVRILINDSDHR